jgi:hypothetical protein
MGPWAPALRDFTAKSSTKLSSSDDVPTRQRLYISACNHAGLWHPFPLPSLHWSTIVASKWQRIEHINSLELRALTTGVRWALSFPSSYKSKILCLSDSTVSVSCVRKGRSSSPPLLRRLRSLAALLLSVGTSVQVEWIPTFSNPADAASRTFDNGPSN